VVNGVICVGVAAGHAPTANAFLFIQECWSQPVLIFVGDCFHCANGVDKYLSSRLSCGSPPSADAELSLVAVGVGPVGTSTNRLGS